MGHRYNHKAGCTGAAGALRRSGAGAVLLLLVAVVCGCTQSEIGLDASAAAGTLPTDPGFLAAAMEEARSAAGVVHIAVHREERLLAELMPFLESAEASAGTERSSREHPSFATDVTTGLYYRGTDSRGDTYDNYVVLPPVGGSDDSPVGDAVPGQVWARRQVGAGAARSLVARRRGEPTQSHIAFEGSVVPLDRESTTYVAADDESPAHLWPDIAWIDPRASGYAPWAGQATWDQVIQRGTDGVNAAESVALFGELMAVLDVPLATGRSRVWIDPAHGYLVRQVEYYTQHGEAGEVLYMRMEMPDVQGVASGDREGSSVWLPRTVERRTWMWGQTDTPTQRALPQDWARITIRGPGNWVGVCMMEEQCTYTSLTADELEARLADLPSSGPLATQPTEWWWPEGVMVRDFAAGGLPRPIDAK